MDFSIVLLNFDVNGLIMVKKIQYHKKCIHLPPDKAKTCDKPMSINDDFTKTTVA